MYFAGLLTGTKDDADLSFYSVMFFFFYPFSVRERLHVKFDAISERRAQLDQTNV